MIACSISQEAINYLIPSHISGEQGHHLMLEHLGLVPMLHLGMRLGEGTGAVLAMNLVEAACRTMAEMASFEQAGVSELEEDKML